MIFLIQIDKNTITHFNLTTNNIKIQKFPKTQKSKFILTHTKLPIGERQRGALCDGKGDNASGTSRWRWDQREGEWRERPFEREGE